MEDQTTAVADEDEHVDEEILGEVLMLLEDEASEGLMKACDLFRSGVPARLAEVDAALADNHFDDAARASHSLRGSAGAFGARRLRSLGERLEQFCRESDGPSAVRVAEEMRAEFSVFRAILDARLAELSGRHPGAQGMGSVSDGDLTVRRDRWLGCGHSVDPDGLAAGAKAALEAVQGRSDVKLLVVFCSEAYDLDALLRGIASEARSAPLIGCSTAGEIATAGPADASVVVIAIGGPGFSVATGVGTDSSGQLRQATTTAVEACMATVERRAHSVVLLLTDGLGGDQMEVVRGAYAVVGAEIPLVGGCAGDDLKMKRTFQFFGDRVLRDSVVAAAVSSDAPIGIGVQHGWRRVGEPMLVTSSTGSRVHTLDDEPALDVYLRRSGAPADVHDDAEAFTRFALTHPLGISRRTGEEVRFVAGADFEDRSVACIASVPQGGLAWIMEGDEHSVLEATDGACAEALADLGDDPPLGLIAFDCIARRGVLGDPGIKREIEQIAAFAGGAPVAGFYTYGEIARTSGTRGFHNQTLVVLALA